MLALVGIIAARQHEAIAAPFVILALLCLIRVPKAYFRGRRRLW